MAAAIIVCIGYSSSFSGVRLSARSLDTVPHGEVDELPIAPNVEFDKILERPVATRQIAVILQGYTRQLVGVLTGEPVRADGGVISGRRSATTNTKT
jgi:hypothetical protein